MRTTGFRARFVVLVCLAILFSLSIVPWLVAGPFSGRILFVQPDGTQIEIWGQGDEFHAVFETLDGYTVVFDDAQKAYCYAVPATGRRSLVSSGVQVHRRSGEEVGVARHLRASEETVRIEAAQRRSAWAAQMDIRKVRVRGIGTTKTPLGFPHNAIVGAKVGLCLLVDFEDEVATIPQAEIEQFCNGSSYSGFGNWGSVRQYFAYNSNGKLDYRNIVTAYIRIPNSLHPKKWYADTSKGAGEQGNYLLRDALDILKALPNFENEIKPALAELTLTGAGEVLACNVFYAGGNGGVWSRALWPHSYSLAVAGAQELWPGGPKVNRYQMSNIGSDLSLGTFCHENGHLLCRFPDIYDYGYDSVGGAGGFCAMNSGGHGKNPVQFCAYLKAAADWATLTDLMTTPASTITLSAAPGPGFNHFYYFMKPGSDREYFLIENRYQQGCDSALPGSGIAIWHVDEDGDRDNQNLNFNSLHVNYEVTLVQADNRWDFQRNANSGQPADLYFNGNPDPGYGNAFSDTSLPPARWWNGAASRLSLSDFSAPGPDMTAYFSLVGAPSGEAPFVVFDPLSQLVSPGTNITLAATALGAQPLAYQWFRGDQAISGATAPTLPLTVSGMDSLGAYTVIVQNQYGSATSQVAQVLGITEPSRLPLGNYSYMLAIMGNLAFVTGSDGALAVVDIADPARPRHVSRYATANSTIGVALSSQHACLGARDQGLLVTDISDPYNPRTVAKCDTGGDTRDVLINGTIAYVSDVFGGLVVVDISNPLQPQIVGQCRATASKGERLALFDHYIAMACQEAGLQVIDIAEPSSPVLVGGYVSERVAGKDQNAVGITVVNGIAYLAENQGGMKIIDVRNPAMPVFLGHGPTLFAKCIAVSGTRAYVADYLEGLVVFDISDPRDPKRLGVLDTSGNSETVQARGDYLYMVDGNGGLLIRKILTGLEQTRPEFFAQPASQVADLGTTATLRGSVFGSGTVSLQWLRDGQPIPGATDATLSLPNVQSTDAGAYQLRASNAAGEILSKAAVLSVLHSVKKFPLPGEASGVVIQQNRAYVASGSAGLTILDLSNTASPVVLGGLDTAKSVVRVAVQGNYACLGEDWGELIVVDISDPAHPRRTGSLGFMGTAQDVVMVGDFALAAYGSDGIFAVSLTNPAAPLKVGNGKAINSANGLRLARNLACVSDGQAGLSLYDVSDPLQIRYLGGAKPRWGSVAVAAEGGDVLLADSSSEVLRFNAANPARPSRYAAVSTPSNPQRLAMLNGLALVAKKDGSLDFLALPDSENATVLRTLSLGSNARDVAVDGNLAVVSDGTNGVAVFRIDTPSLKPVVAQPPQARVCSAGDTVPLNAAVTGPGPFVYQWFHDATPIPGATDSNFTVTDFDAAKAGSYWVEVSNSFGTTRSPGADLVLDGPPIILTQPAWGSMETGLGLSAGVSAAGLPGLTYQWFKDGTPLAGMTTAELSLTFATTKDSGSYVVRVSNSSGSVDSQPLSLTVTPDVLDLESNVQLPHYAFGVGMVPGYAFVAGADAGLVSVDISNSSGARLIGTSDTPGYSKGLCISGNYAYVADGVENGGVSALRVFDISFPTAPALVGSLETGGDAADVAVRNGLAYLADGPRGLQVVDVSNPAVPVPLGLCDTPVKAVRVALSGNYAFVADRDSGVQIIDISRPEAPSIAARYDTPKISVGVTIDKDLLYVADETGGLLILDIANPVKPVLRSAFKTGMVKASAVAGQYVFVGDWASGLFVMDTSDLKMPFVLKNWKWGNDEFVAVMGKTVSTAAGLARKLMVFNCGLLSNPGNQSPVLTPVGDKTVQQGDTLSFSVGASDLDSPAGMLTCKLGPGAPPGAAISRDGRFRWETSLEVPAPATFPVTIQVLDEWSVDSETINVRMLPAASEATPVSYRGLLAWYPLESNADDYGLDQHHGRVLGAPPATNRWGKAGAAFYVSPGKYVELPTFAWPSRTNFSLVAWLKPGPTNIGDKHFMGKNSRTATTFLIRTFNGNYMAQSQIGSDNRYAFTSVVPNTNAFDFVVLSYDGAWLRFYINGVLAGSTAATGEVATNASPILLGAPSTEGYGSAIVDDFKVYDHALTAQEINALWLGFGPPNSPPVLTSISDRVVEAGGTLSFTAAATDSDGPLEGLNFGLASDAPWGASMTRSGQFTWTPLPFQAPSTNLITIRVSDAWSTATETIRVTVTSTNPPPDPVLANGLLAWYPFEGNAADYGPQGFHGVMNGAEPAADRFGKDNLACAVSSGRSMQLPSFPWPSHTSLSVALWVKAGLSTNGFYDFVSKTESSRTQVILRTFNGRYMAELGTPSGNQSLFSSISPSANRFDLLVVTYNDPNLRFYINTNMVASKSAPGGIITNNAVIGIGEKLGVPAIVDDLRFYDHALSMPEIVQLYTDNHTPVVSPVPDIAADENSEIRFQVSATDADSPSQPISFSLGSGAPAGAFITAGGLFTWTPSEIHGPGTHTITVRATDGLTVGSASVRIVVNEVNTEPALHAVEDKFARAGSLLSFQVTASDADLPTQPLTFSLGAGAPVGAAITGDGLFTWTPTEAHGWGTNLVTIQVSDGYATTGGIVRIILVPPNRPPVLMPAEDRIVAEQATLTFMVTASDEDFPAQPLTFSLDDPAPAGASITPEGVFAWTPTEAQGPGTHFVTMRASDGLATASRTIQIVVTEANRAPEFSAQTAAIVAEFGRLIITNSAVDPDIPPNVVTYQLLSPPDGAAIDDNGVITWTPAESHGPGTNIITTVGTDDGTPPLSTTNLLNVVVTEVNSAPVLPAIGNKSIAEGALLAFAATATDEDLPAQQLTFRLGPGAPAGASITPQGLFAWTPAEDQAPATNLLTIQVSDGLTQSEETIEVVADEVNEAPILMQVGDKTVSQGNLLTFTALATDGDLPAQLLTFSLEDGAPQGATITSGGRFSWTPNDTQGPATNTLTIRVSDGVAATSETIRVVVRESNGLPAMAPIGNQVVAEGSLLSFRVTATDPDIPTQPLTFRFEYEAPAGANITKDGQFSWTPTEDQGPSTNMITVQVSDGWDQVSQTFRVIVTELNQTPVMPAQAPRLVDALSTLTVTNTAADPDLPANTLSYRLVGPPAGATINEIGIISWTPANAQAPSTNLITTVVTDNGEPPLSATNQFIVVVDLVGSGPPVVLFEPIDLVVNQGDPAAFSVKITGARPLALRWLKNGIAISGATNGMLAFPSAQPGDAGIYRLVVSNALGSATSSAALLALADPNNPTLTAVSSLKVWAQIDGTSDLVIYPNAVVWHHLSWSRPGLHTTPPEPTRVNGTNWYPTWPDGNSSGTAWSSGYSNLTVNFRKQVYMDTFLGRTKPVLTVQPAAANGYTTTVQFKDDPVSHGYYEVVLKGLAPATGPTNSRPVLPAQVDRTIRELTTLVVTNTATDLDLPANVLSYQLIGAPPGAMVDANGIISWTPTAVQGPSTNLFTTWVRDNGLPSLSATNRFTVLVIEPPRITLAISLDGSKCRLQFDGSPSQKFEIEVSDDLTHWSTAHSGILSSGGFEWLDERSQTLRFYRLKLTD